MKLDGNAECTNKRAESSSTKRAEMLGPYDDIHKLR